MGTTLTAPNSHNVQPMQPTKKFQPKIEQILVKDTPTIRKYREKNKNIENDDYEQLVYYDHHKGGYTEAQPSSAEMRASLDPDISLQKEYKPGHCLDVDPAGRALCRDECCTSGSRRLARFVPRTGMSVATGLLSSSFLLLGGFLAYRCMRRFQTKPEPRRDSFGFLSDSRRTSFTHGEKMV